MPVQLAPGGALPLSLHCSFLDSFHFECIASSRVKRSCEGLLVMHDLYPIR